MSPGRPGAAESPTPRLLEVLGRLVADLHPRRERRPIRLDDDLERDLGLDSLARTELLSRLEGTFDVRLSEARVMTAISPRELAAAVEAALGSAGPPGAGRRNRVLGGAGAEVAGEAGAAASDFEGLPLDGAETLVGLIESHVQRHPDRGHILFLPEEGEPVPFSYGELGGRARAVAAGLVAGGLEPGQTVALMLPTSLDYFAAFAGVLFAGATPVPLYPPVRRSQVEDHLRRQAGILTTAEVRVMIASSEVRPLARLLSAQIPTLRHTVSVADLEASGGATRLPQVRPEDLAFLQFTSGSTGNPKGVMLTHANLLANLRSMGAALRMSERDTIVSWLPLYHDMGLIGAWMGSLAFGSRLVLMSPLTFLARPVRWLEALHRYRGTVSAAPNFAYELCLKKVEDDEIEGLDLASWRLALNGAEPVSPETVRRFAERFAPYGFRSSAVFPVYGLAENSLGVAFPPLGRGPVVARLDREAFSRHSRAVEAAPDDEDALRFVGCGFAIPDHEVRIVDAAGRDLPEGQEGRIHFRGPSATAGYYRNPEATAELVHGDWRDSGDLGFLLRGELFVTGRAKDLIIRAGRNLYPQELEEAVGLVPGVRRGCVAVFGSKDPRSGTERLVVLAETRATSPEERGAIEEEIQRVAVDRIGTPVDEVVLAPPQAVPKTSSGKIRRSSARQLYEAGEVGAKPRALWLQLAGLGLTSARGWLGSRARAAGDSAFALWAWTAFALLAAPVWLGVVLLPGLARRRRFARWAARALAFATGTRLEVEGLETLDAAGQVVLAANHSSYLDAFALSAALPPRFAFVAKKELVENPLARWPLARLGCVFVERFATREAVADAGAAGAALAAGESLVFFPEGTFRRPPGLMGFRLGAFLLAARAGIPVAPAALVGTRAILPAGRWLPRPGSVRVALAPPVAPGGHDLPAAVALRDAVRSAVLERCAEPDREDDRRLPGQA